MKCKYNVLGTADSKGRDQQFAAVLGAGILDDEGQLLFSVVNGRVQAVAVGGFCDDIVGLRERLGIGQNAFVVAAHIACIAECAFASALLETDIYGTAAKHVSGIDKFHGKSLFDEKFVIVWPTGKQRHGVGGIFHGVNRLHRRQSLFAAFFVELDGIRLLDTT